jgi:hypothetical protein
VSRGDKSRVIGDRIAAHAEGISMDRKIRPTFGFEPVYN